MKIFCSVTLTFMQVEWRHFISRPARAEVAGPGVIAVMLAVTITLLALIDVWRASRTMSNHNNECHS